MSRIAYRPIGTWTDPVTPDDQRRSSPFSSPWSKTRDLLVREVNMVAPRGVDPIIVISVDVSTRDIRADGFMRADTRVRSDGIVVSFDSIHGPLRYACDAFTKAAWKRDSIGWQANVRAVALGLQALRRVAEYGIGRRGEQYTGWAQLGSGIPMGMSRDSWTMERAFAALGINPNGKPVTAYTIAAAYTELAKIHHPDVGGDAEVMKEINAARAWLLDQF